MSVRLDARLASCSGFGFVLGAATAGGAYELYPPAKDHVWPMATLAAVSIVGILVLYLIVVRFGAVNLGDWLIVGYTVALIVAAGLVVTREITETLRDHVPENLGVKISALPAVKGVG
ncbi:MAG TPA: hypothetical protein VFD92_07090 [Candidatus Binatia bacterium]|nr:hypothetical protein [Candidatus Binatia bacterium]